VRVFPRYFEFERFSKYNSTASKRSLLFWWTKEYVGSSTDICDSVRRSLFKHNSAAGKDLYSSGGQKNTLAQVSMHDPVRRSLCCLSNITLPWSSAFTLLGPVVQKPISLILG
jgi:hypothetical protein